MRRLLSRFWKWLIAPLHYNGPGSVAHAKWCAKEYRRENHVGRWPGPR